MNQFMLDTNTFNVILDTPDIEPSKLSCCGKFFVTHIQLNEIQATKKPPERLSKLLAVFETVEQDTVPTAAAVFDVSEYGNSEWSDANGDYDRILLLLKQKRSKSRGNANDALIGVTALKRRYTLVTNDPDLLASVIEMGGSAITLKALLANAG